MKNNTDNRIVWIDAWRGVAVLSMIFLHIVQLVDFGDIAPIDSLSGGWYWYIQLTRFSFLGLVGVSMVLMLNMKFAGKPAQSFWAAQLVRFRTVGMWALAATAASWVAYPELFIRFGILHFIAVAIVLCMWVAHVPKVAGFLGVIALLFGWALQLGSTDSWFLHWLGAWPAYPFSSMDFFPLFPWLALPLFGITFGHWLFKKERIVRIDSVVRGWPGVEWFTAIGRKALQVYVWQGAAFLLLIFIGRLVFL